jgi:hypothetical protein
VFGIVELLENILSYADMQTLFIAQRVNKACFDIICGSSIFQKRMYLMPVASFAEAKELGIVGEDSKVWYHVGNTLGKYNQGGEPKHLVLNPMLLREAKPRSALDCARWATFSDRVLGKLKSNISRQGTWTSMLLMQPPHYLYGELVVTPASSPQNQLGDAGLIVTSVYAGGQSMGETMSVIEGRAGTFDWASSTFRFSST